MHEIAGAIIAIILMAAVFIPVVFMSGPVGGFSSPPAFSPLWQLAAYIFRNHRTNAYPALCAMLKTGKLQKEHHNRFLDGFNATFNNTSENKKF
jgi:HAE1 family hydrophobic/amphiphilic exporter-1